MALPRGGNLARGGGGLHLERGDLVGQHRAVDRGLVERRLQLGERGRSGVGSGLCGRGQRERLLRGGRGLRGRRAGGLRRARGGRDRCSGGVDDVLLRRDLLAEARDPRGAAGDRLAVRPEVVVGEEVRELALQVFQPRLRRGQSGLLGLHVLLGGGDGGRRGARCRLRLRQRRGRSRQRGRGLVVGRVRVLDARREGRDLEREDAEPVVHARERGEHGLPRLLARTGGGARLREIVPEVGHVSSSGRSVRRVRGRAPPSGMGGAT